MMSGKQANGKHNINLSLDEFSSGVYVIVLTTDEGKQAKQLIITK